MANDNEEQPAENPSEAIVAIEIEINLPTGKKIHLPQVPLSENINSVKMSLTEYRETFMYTSYSLHSKSVVVNGIAKPFEKVLNEFMELEATLDPSTTKIVLNLVSTDYSLKTARKHVKKIHDSILDPPSLQLEEAKKPVAEDKKENNPSSEAPSDTTHQFRSYDVLNSPIGLTGLYSDVMLMSSTPSVALTEEPRKVLSEVVKNIYYSGWCPPPPARRVQGDLFYLEVMTGSEGIFYITAIPSGFYVNKSNRNHFDPSPIGPNCHFSHNLFNTLLSISPKFREAWNNFSLGNSESSQFEENDSSVYNPLQGVAKLHFEGKADQISLVKPWLEFAPEIYSTEVSKKNYHAFDMLRAQDNLGDLCGVDELGASREWNDEMQALRALKSKNLNEKVLKARFELKIINEFTEACKKASRAILNGLIAPLNFDEPQTTVSEIHVYNGIFFSRAEDSKDSIQMCNSAETFRKTVSKDLKNQKLIQSLGIPGLSTVLCTMVDYKGQRIVGQSIIPGILSQGENSARLMHGVLDTNQTLTMKNSSLSILKKIAEKLNYLPERKLESNPFPKPDKNPAENSETSDKLTNSKDPINQFFSEPGASPIKVDTEDNVVEAGNPVPHIGPVEGKTLKGADGRVYIFEMFRLTPRDANFVLGEKGTGKIPQNLLSKGGDNAEEFDMGTAYVLRQELVEIYIQRQINIRRQEIITEITEREKTKEKPSPESQETPSENPPAFTSEDLERIRGVTPLTLHLEINPNCFLNVQPDVDPAVVLKDETTVREISLFLWDIVIPDVTRQIRENEFIPRDSESMIQLLHRMGVNLRYLGRLIHLAQEEELCDMNFVKEGKQRIHSMPLYWLDMLLVEVLARCTKHLLNSLFRQDPRVAAAPATTVTSLLNHLFSVFVQSPEGAASTQGFEGPQAEDREAEKKEGEKKGGSKKKKKKNSKAKEENEFEVRKPLKGDVPLSPDATSSLTDSLQKLVSLASERFFVSIELTPKAPTEGATGNDLPPVINVSTIRERVAPLTLLRRVCQLCGIRLSGAKENLDLTTPNPFSPADLLDLEPVIKSCEPSVLLPEYHECLNASVESMNQGNSMQAYELADQALNLISQVTGASHPLTIQALEQLMTILLSINDLPAALQIASRGMQMAFELKGLDCAEVLLHHVQLTDIYLELYQHQEMQVAADDVKQKSKIKTTLTAASKHLYAARYLVKLMGGDRHSELSNLFMKTAILYDKAGDFKAASDCLVGARQFTGSMLKSCILLISSADLYFRYDYVYEAIATQMHSFKVLKEILGEEDERVLDVKKNLEKYMRASKENENIQRARMQLLQQTRLEREQQVVPEEKADQMKLMQGRSVEELEKWLMEGDGDKKKKGGKKQKQKK